MGIQASWEGSTDVEVVTCTPYVRFQHPPESQMLFTYLTIDINREVRHIRPPHCNSNGSWNLCTKSETVNKTSFLIKTLFVFVRVAYSRLTLFATKKDAMNCTIFKHKASSMLLVYHFCYIDKLLKVACFVRNTLSSTMYKIESVGRVV